MKHIYKNIDYGYFSLLKDCEHFQWRQRSCFTLNDQINNTRLALPYDKRERLYLFIMYFNSKMI